MIQSSDWLALLPIIVVTLATIGVMLGAAFYRRHSLTFLLTLGGFVAGLLTLPLAARVAPQPVTPLLIVDHYALFYMGLMLVAGIIVTLLSYGYLEDYREQQREEFYILLLLATLGALVLVASRHFAALFLGLELISVSLFPLIAYPLNNRRSLEAGLKYLVLSSVASAFLLFGMALIYADLGTLVFASVRALFQAGPAFNTVYLTAGLALLATGIGFKLSLVPFHLWTPDVYQGAPAPVTAFLATVSKGAVFALLLRYFTTADLYYTDGLLGLFSLIAMACMLVGNLLALLASHIKRMLAYSSIAHLGYLLVALVAGSTLGMEAAAYYLVAYVVTTLGAFGVVTVLSAPAGPGEADDLGCYRGLFRQRPWIAGVFTLMLLSLAGLPLTAGFIGKFYLFIAGVQSLLWPLLFTLIIGSALGLYYYLRVVAIMAAPLAPEASNRIGDKPIPLTSVLALALLTLALLVLGVYPAPLMEIIKTTTTSLIY